MVPQMTAKTLNALKGWPQQAAVDFHTEYGDEVFDLVDVVDPGMVLHLDADGLYQLGVGDENVMPLFAFNGSHDPDVLNDGGDAATEKGVWVPMSPTGQAMALVGIIAAELVSTAFVDGQYDPNDPLTADDSGADAGKLAVGVIGTNMIVGFVSRGVVDNGWGHDAVAFWPHPVFPGP